MTTARTPSMTAENLQESARLNELWQQREVRLSQRAFGEAYKIGNQSSVNQFLQGKIPISLRAAVGFAAGLHCQIEDFSPRLAGLIAEANAVSGPVGNMPATWGALPPKPGPAPRELPAYLEFITSMQHKSDLFAEFMNRAEIRLMVRLLPAADPHDVMISLLKSAFDNGFDQGAHSVAVQMLSGSLVKIEK